MIYVSNCSKTISSNRADILVKNVLKEYGFSDEVSLERYVIENKVYYHIYDYVGREENKEMKYYKKLTLMNQEEYENLLRTALMKDDIDSLIVSTYINEDKASYIISTLPKKDRVKVKRR